jgi:hypothetical protein
MVIHLRHRRDVSCRANRLPQNIQQRLVVSSWLQIRRSWVRFPGTTRKKKVVGLERGPLSLASTTEELLGRNSSGSGLESLEYGRRDFFLLFIYSLASG